MNKQIKTDEGNIIELDENLVSLIKAESYCVDDESTEGGHFCIKILDIWENDNAAETVFENGEEVGALYKNEEIFAFWLQQNGYGNIKEFAEKLQSLFCKEGVYNGEDIKISIRELVEKVCYTPREIKE